MGLTLNEASPSESLRLGHHTLRMYFKGHSQSLDMADSKRITEMPGRSSRIKKVFDYAGLDANELDEQKLVSSGSCIAILPPDSSESDRLLLTELTSIQDNVIKKFRISHGLRTIPDLPITTICFPNHKMVDKTCSLGNTGVSPWAGAISLNYASLWDTFNLQAAQWTIKKYGEVGKKAVIFSHLHESGHQVMEQHRHAICRSKGITDWEFAGSFRRPYWKIRVPWELSANEQAASADVRIQIGGNPVYPDYFGSLSDREMSVSGKSLIDDFYKNIPDESRLYYPKSEYQQPFVVDRDDAKLWLTISKESIPNNKRSWTGWMTDFIDKNPLIS